MCHLCEGNLDYSITRLICHRVTEIPKEFTQLTYLNCSFTNITEIPKEFTQLTHLYCSYTNITEIPKELSQLTVLGCDNTKITEIPKEFTQLTELYCSNTKMTEIPFEFTQLTVLYCSNTEIPEIPKEFTKLTDLFCLDCPNLVKVPEKFKEEYINEYNFLRVPALSRLKFNNYKRSYSENIRLQLEIKFNEVYYAPTGIGALELFEKYKLTEIKYRN
jgi:Leucine-rich repeat (LRR) protein